jgi:hypothetical protein
VAFDRARDDALEHVVQPCKRIETVQPSRLEKRRQDGPAFGATAASGEQTIPAAQSNLAVILPMSGQK